MMKRLFCGALLIVLAACTASQPSETPAGPRGTVPTATPPPPVYSEPQTAITRDTIAQLAYLGRLDAPSRPSTVFAYDFSPDGTRLAALNNDLLLNWNLVTGDVVFSNQRSNHAWVFYSSDKDEIYAIRTTGEVDIFETERGSLENTFQGHTRFVSLLDFYQRDGWLAMGGEDGTVKVWDSYGRQSLATLTAHDSAITALAFSHDGERLAASAEDGIVRLWDWQKRERLAEFDHNGALVTKIVFAPDGLSFATLTPSAVFLWSLEAGNLLHVLQTGPSEGGEVLVFSPDGQYLVTSGASENMNLWNPENGNLVGRLPEISGNRVSAAFSPGGDFLVTSMLEGPVVLWDMGQISSEAIGRANIDFITRQALMVDWTPDGFTLAVFDSTGPVYVWGVGTPAAR